MSVPPDSTPEPTAPPPAVDAGLPVSPRVTRWWLTRSDQTFVALCTALLLGVVVVQYVRQGALSGQLVDIERLPQSRYAFRIEINSANWVEWSQLDGIGEVLGRRIVSFREENGPFTAVADLRRVPGIGPKTFESMRPYVYLKEHERSAEDELKLDSR